MPRADQRLYAALLRMGERFRAERLPLLGVAGSPLVCWDLSWQAAARAALEAPPPGAGLTEGAQLLVRLQAQLEVLVQAEDHTREALAEWAALADRFGAQYSSSAAFLPFAAAAAAEEGLALLTRQSRDLADPLHLELEEASEGAGGGDGGREEGQPPATSLDSLAAEVRQQHPELFDGGGDDRSSTSSVVADAGLARQRAAALSAVLHRGHRFRCEPFEWVYEGLQPLLLPPTLRRRKLAPITLAAAAAGVGRRLGLPLLPVPAESGEGIAAGVAEGPAGGIAGSASGPPLELLRPDLAQRYAGRASAAPPASGPWVLLLPAAHGGGSVQEEQQQQQQRGQWPGQPWLAAMDACTGELLGAAAVQAKFPGLALQDDWALRAPLTAWQHAVRTIIQAHQRRGESDLVAHWVYVLLALDPGAQEWGHMLAPGQGLS